MNGIFKGKDGMTSETTFYPLLQLERDMYRKALADLKNSGVLDVSLAENHDIRQAYPTQSKKRALKALEKFDWEPSSLSPTETAGRRRQLMEIQHWAKIQTSHSRLGPRARWSLSFALFVGVVMVSILTRFESLYTSFGWWMNVIPTMCAGYAIFDYYSKTPRSWFEIIQKHFSQYDPADKYAYAQLRLVIANGQYTQSHMHFWLADERRALDDADWRWAQSQATTGALAAV